MEDEATQAEVVRLMSGITARANRLARWDNVYQMWQAKFSLSEIAFHIGRSESTVRQLLKRGVRYWVKQGSFAWPRDRQGRKLCDVPHPRPQSDHDFGAWSHSKVRSCQNGKYCPVCRHRWQEAKTLVEIFREEVKKIVF